MINALAEIAISACNDTKKKIQKYILFIKLRRADV